MSALPHERFVYLGDTARVPYGSKPLAMVREFAAEITAELLARDVKAIVIACNTASAASLPELAKRCTVPVWGVVEPGVAAALRALTDAPGANDAYEDSGRSGATAASGGVEQVIGVLGTAATIEARVYQDRLEAAGASTWARACPLFVPLVEEGLQDSEIANLVVDHYLGGRPRLASLILGCTHYPLLKPALRAALGDGVELVDSSEAVAAFVSTELARLGLLNGYSPANSAADRLTAPATRLEYLVTGDVDVFLHTAGRLGGPRAPASRVLMNGTRRGIWPLGKRVTRSSEEPSDMIATAGDRSGAA